MRHAALVPVVVRAAASCGERGSRLGLMDTGRWLATANLAEEVQTQGGSWDLEGRLAGNLYLIAAAREPKPAASDAAAG
jgi:hypothetical protein